MTPIQKHKDELIAMLEQAGLDPGPLHHGGDSYGCMLALHPGADDNDSHPEIELSGSPSRYEANYVYQFSRHFIASASHANPVVALRACLEMAGLLQPIAEQRIAAALVAMKEAYKAARYQATASEVEALTDTIARILTGQPLRNHEGATLDVTLLPERMPEVKP